MTISRAALYARYSSDKQLPRSVADQILLCRELAAKQGWRVVGVYADAECRGAILWTRDGVQQLLQVAAERYLDVVIAESLDRISRSQADTARIWELLQWHGVDIHTLVEGRINELHIGLTGTMSALFVKNLVQKTRRGLRARASEGHAVGRPPYGYAADAIQAPDGSLVKGRRRIVPEQAAIVRRIFEEFVAGRSLRAIARDLTADGVPSPTGRSWRGTTLHRTPNARGQRGIVHNPVYIGRLEYGRTSVDHHPDTGAGEGGMFASPGKTG